MIPIIVAAACSGNQRRGSTPAHKPMTDEQFKAWQEAAVCWRCRELQNFKDTGECYICDECEDEIAEMASREAEWKASRLYKILRWFRLAK